MNKRIFSITAFSADNAITEVLKCEYARNELSFVNKRIAAMMVDNAALVIQLSPDHNVVIKRLKRLENEDKLDVRITEGVGAEMTTTSFRVMKNPGTGMLMSYTQLPSSVQYFKNLEEKIF